MTSTAENCCRLSRDCGQWAVESRDNAVRVAFRQMSKGWARVAFSEEFTLAADERIEPLKSENAEPTAVEKLALSLSPPQTSTQPVTGATARVRFSIRFRTLLPKAKPWDKRLSSPAAKI